MSMLRFQCLSAIKAFERYGAPILDNCSANGVSAQHTDGDPPQWQIANDYKPQPADLVDNSTNWRELPGNKHWVEAEQQGRLVYEQRSGDRYPSWHLDGDPVPNADGDR